MIYPSACKNQPLKPWMKHALQSTAQLVQKNMKGRLYMPLDHSTLRYPMFNAPDMLQEWFHWVIQPAMFEESEPLCNYVLIFSHNGTGHNKIWNARQLGWSKRKNVQNFSHAGLSQEVEAGKG